jgi:hypothetical protein
MAQVRVASLANEFTHLEGKQQDGLLTSQTHSPRQGPRGEAVKVRTVQRYLSRLRPQVAADNFQQRGLAGTIWANDGHNFSGMRFEAYGSQFKVRVTE